MRRIQVVLLCCVCLVAWAAPAAALVEFSQTEEFGPASKTAKKPSDPRFALAYLPGRVYALHSTWSGFGHNRDEGVVAYEGDAAGANQALAEFGALPAATVKEIHLLPGPGRIRSLKGKLTLHCDWEIRWSSYVPFADEKHFGSPAHTAVMTIYVDRAALPRPLDARTLEWINDLDHERFDVRQRAFKNLADQGDAARPLLEKTSEAAPTGAITLEAKCRIDQLLSRLKPIHAARLRLPKGIPVVSIDQLLRREAKNWRSGDLSKSWHASEKISAWAEYTEESMPFLIEMLHDDREQVRDLAVSAFKRLGGRAAATLPALEEAESKAQKPVYRNSLRQVQRALAAATPGAEDPWRRNREQRAEIEQFLQTR
ncbi:MAG: hypothetical protein L0Y72_03490 [Gemmataceae bacterium]|nr:hypothetical protein [Gemmataceae bacterium]MCI0738081.1 hypothetical protein [Gemmataceae bacterium]